MRVLLVSTYELGHQPLHVASPAAALLADGHEVRCLDLSVDPYDEALVAWAEAVAFSVPMHTAMRLAIQGARRIKEGHASLPVCFYGLYAPVSRDLTAAGPDAPVDRLIAGEYEAPLKAWLRALEDRPEQDGSLIHLGHDDFRLPARHLLPALERYAHLSFGDSHRVVGYTEASHGCAHECRHCPLPVVYGGRIRLVPHEVVLADIEQLVRAGAKHLTFGDPDWLNGWRHSLRLAEELHASWPELTFDCTTKVEHVLKHERSWHRFARAGCLFVVSAFESVNDNILVRLDKGHVTADAITATEMLRAHGIEVRPSFLPFVPWTSGPDLVELLEFVIAHDLVSSVDPVQYSIRLLLPEGSLLLEHPDIQGFLDGYDQESLSYRWHSADPAMDRLQGEIAAVVERDAETTAAPEKTFEDIRGLVEMVTGRAVVGRRIPAGSLEGRPRLTEPWFC